MSQGVAAEPATPSVAVRAWEATVRAWDRAPVREPWRVLAPLVVVQWVAVGLFALSVHHNGWLFYQGGDQIWYWASSWLLGHHGVIPVPRVSYGWPIVLLPFSWIWGGSYLAGLPATVLLQTVVLAPIALYCMYDIGARIGGRIVGYVSAAAWTIGPYLVIPLFTQRYHEKYVDQFLPHPLGLTAMADYPALVLLLVAGALGLRAVQSRDPGTALVAGLAAGLSAGMKPSNLIWPPALFVLLLLARRWRETLAFGIGLLPALGALVLWKYRGFGYVPALQSAYPATRLAAGSDTLFSPYHHYVHINWHQLHINQLQLGEFFFSVRVLEVAPIVGAIAVARRSWPAAAFLSVWFWSYVVLKGSSDNASVENGSFFRFLLPAAPALLLMLAALPVLVPRVGPHLADRFRPVAPRALSRKTVIAAIVALGLIPLAAAGAARPEKGPNAMIQVRRVATPVDGGIALRADVKGRTVVLTWRAPGTAGVSTFYKLVRAAGPTDVRCDIRPGAADECLVNTVPVRTLRGTSAVDRPGTGTWTYRVGVAANYLNDPTQGDVFLVSPPVTVTVRWPVIER